MAVDVELELAEQVYGAASHANDALDHRKMSGKLPAPHRQINRQRATIAVAGD
jgi:hypothetical protein